MLEDIRVTHLLLIYTLEPEAGPEEWDYENQVAKPFFLLFSPHFLHLPNKQIFNYQMTEDL